MYALNSWCIAYAAPSWRDVAVGLLDVFATSNIKQLVANITVDNADCLYDHCLISADIAVPPI